MVEQVKITQGEENVSLEEQSQQQDASTEVTQEAQVEETSNDRPEWLPEKFTNAEELAKAYGELEKKFSKPADTPVETKDLKIDNTEEAKSNPTLEPFYNEYTDKGSLTDESYNKLNEMGIPKDVVDAYISGQEALSAKHNEAMVATEGGQEQYNNMVQWAAQNLSKGEIEAFNNAVDGASLDQAQLAIAGVNAKFQSNTREPNLFSGQKSESNVGYESVAQMLADINNPKYKEDPAFRKSVEAKVSKSNIM